MRIVSYYQPGYSSEVQLLSLAGWWGIKGFDVSTYPQLKSVGTNSIDIHRGHFCIHGSLDISMTFSKKATLFCSRM